MKEGIPSRSIPKGASAVSHYVEEELGSPDFIDFLWIVNERRPYCSWDFKEQYMIPDLDE